jgi:hypothetical protein
MYLAVSGMWWARPSSRTQPVSASRSRSGPAEDVSRALSEPSRSKSLFDGGTESAEGGDAAQQ